MRYIIKLIIILALNLSTSVMANESPRVTTINGVAKVVLPPTFLTAIARDYPGLRVPIEKDMTGYWSHAIGGPYPYYPYIAWGDYDNNKLTDIAIILVSDTQWAFAIYHQFKGGAFALALPDIHKTPVDNAAEPPQNYYVRTHTKGKPWIYSSRGVGLGYRFEKNDIYDFDNDVVAHGILEHSSIC